MKYKKNLIFLEALFWILSLFMFCEYLHTYFVIKKCQWPILTSENEDLSIKKVQAEPLKVLVITDIHLLGPKRGIWLDERLREWEMYRVFRTTLDILEPEIVFVLGDIFDEGLISSTKEFAKYVQKYNNLFFVSETTKRYTLVGNHDIGFHDEITRRRAQLFSDSFDSPDVRMITLKDNHFVLINSMAMEGDDCFLCEPARKKLAELERVLKCAKETFNGTCEMNTNETMKFYSRPILMQHFPLYRSSDMECDDFDAAPLPEKQEPFKEAYDCLSKNATTQLLDQIEPRLSLSGHTHHGCSKKLPNGDGLEITIPSLNFRNKNNPTIGLGVFTPNNYAFVRCPIPRESTRITIYILGITLIFFRIYFVCRRHQTRHNFCLC